MSKKGKRKIVFIEPQVPNLHIFSQFPLPRLGFLVLGIFVLGFDEDDWPSVKKMVKFAKKSQLSTTQFLILTPLPGSEFYEKMSSENCLRFHDWALYDAHHVGFQPARFSLFDL